MLAIVERKKLATPYFYSQAKVLQQACHSISLPREHIIVLLPWNEGSTTSVLFEVVEPANKAHVCNALGV